MEIVIYNPTQGQPLPPVQWNYTEVKAWIESGLERYKGVVYDESKMAEAKKDRANLRKLADAIDTKRKEMKRTYLEPYEEFEAQAKELVAMVKQQSDAIDAQVKTYENFKKQEKREKIEAEIYAPMIGRLAELVPYDQLHEARWLNVTCSMGTVGEELARKIDNITSGLAAIDKLDLDEALTEQARSIFLKKFDLAAAINATERILEQRAAMERLRASQEATEASEKTSREFNQPETKKTAEVQQGGDNPEEKIYVVDFRVRVNAEKLKKLGDFMRANGIKPERI